MTPNIIITRGGFGRRAHTLFDEILEVVHWRDGSALATRPCSAPTHYAVVIDKRGHLYLGTAHCSEKDQYVKKLGFQVSVGRALKAMEQEHALDKTLPIPLYKGRKLVEAVREIVRS